MGAELTDPLKNCCCANQMKYEAAATMGNNTGHGFEDYLTSNMSWIVKIQACWKGKVARLRYIKKRDERRKKSTHFLAQDQYETVSHRRVLELRLFYDANEAEINEHLIVKQHKYRTSGATYDGQWLGGFRHGQGKMVFRDGAIYEGTWYLGRSHGYGKFTHVKGETYEGEWADDMKHGIGELKPQSGVRYQGNWYKNERRGVGLEILSENQTFYGSYVNNKKNGYGVYKWPDGASYEGSWKDNKITGFGTYKWADGRIFTGEWVNCKTGGFGVYIWPNGQRYEGFFVKDKRQGYGILMTPNNFTYSGGFLNGKQHGYGCLFTSNQQLKYGMYVNGGKVLKLTPEVASAVQEGHFDLYTALKKKQKVDDVVQYWQDIALLTNKFEPFDSFATEQGIYELKVTGLKEQYTDLRKQMTDANIRV